ncbi:hypothetical protein O1611_g9861 [Lasiodiplodia mahajangana]|uniref:Uncharacterized protein n=1 Tax=Lasiodiplodia mahajangana TaxID=1108764 RepID=A0ACC2J4I0_9PEZI|nr:hypothetical protein O1611_g9861 [Lasiodiplodia mahajangana]
MDFDFDPVESGSDIDVYDDEAADNDKSEQLGSDADDDDSSMADLGHDSEQTRSHESSQDSQVLDDDWAGCEDIENRDPDVSIHVDDDAMVDDAGRGVMAPSLDEHEVQSQGSSVPSEYPSNQPL